MPLIESDRLFLTKLGKRIRELREQKGLSQEAFGFQADLHRNYIGGIERGERNVAVLNLKKIAQALNVSLEELFEKI